MKLTPGQIAELRSDGNVRGLTIVDRVQEPLYLVVVGHQAFQRAQQLSNLQALPPGLVWYVAGAAATRVEIHATQPEWFAELEETIQDARRHNTR